MMGSSAMNCFRWNLRFEAEEITWVDRYHVIDFDVGSGGGIVVGCGLGYPMADGFEQLFAVNRLR